MTRRDVVGVKVAMRPRPLESFDFHSNMKIRELLIDDVTKFFTRDIVVDVRLLIGEMERR